MDRPPDVPEFESRPTVRIDQSMPEKGSIITLSDSAFRLMVEAICYCGREETDGRIPKGIITRMATKKTAPAELVTRGHMVEYDGDTWDLPDYLRWNRSAAEIDSFRAAKGLAGEKGAHARWHVPNRRRVKDCVYCYPQAVASA